jgi:hypothetical protein
MITPEARSLDHQEAVFRKRKKSGVFCVKKNIKKRVMFLSKYSLDRNNALVLLMFRPQYTPEFFLADHYGLRNPTSWLSKDLASLYARQKEYRYDTKRFKLGF